MNAEIYGGASDGKEIVVPNPPPHWITYPAGSTETYFHAGSTKEGRLRYVLRGMDPPKQTAAKP